MANVLLAVTGMTPQVITETLYGLERAGEAWPDRVEIITTRKGAEKVRAGLLEHGHLARLCSELGRPQLNSSNLQIHMVPDSYGLPVDDARTLSDHEALADFIMERVRQLTADNDSAVHASIAGGRKTMTFYLGYAMSLFGRVQDRMSHVLVSEGYENHPDFYFPTRERQLISGRDGQPLDMSEAEVSLADIPFVRQRDQLPTMLREPGEGVSFRTLVDLINLGQRPAAIRVYLHDAEMRLDVCDGQRKLESLFFTSRFDWSWYLVVAEATQNGDASLRRKTDGTGSEYLGWKLMERLAHSLGLPFDRNSDYRAQLAAWLHEHEGVLEQASIRPDDFGASMRWGLDVAQATTRLKRRIRQALPEPLAERLVIEQIFDNEGNHLGRRCRGGGYGLNLTAEQITFSQVELHNNTAS